MTRFEKFFEYLLANKHHWELMCDLSDNDYDISYFNGRAVIDEEVRSEIGENGTEEEVIHYLNKIGNEIQETHSEYIKKYGSQNVNRIGELEEIALLLKIIKQNYSN